MGKVDYLELLLNREWEKLYDTTKNRLDNHTAKAFYVTSISGIIGNEEIPNDETAYEIFMNMKDDFEKQKETHPMEYGIFLCRLANFTDESCEKENLFDKGLSYLKPQNNLLYSYYLLPLSLIYQINGDLEKCIALQEEAYHTFKHYKYQLKYQILSNLSWSFHLLRQYDKAISYSKLSIDNLEEKSKILQYHLLFGYCVIHCYAGRRDEVEPYLEKLKKLTEPKNSDEYQLVYALYLKSSTRLAHKIDAERIYRSLIDLEKGVMNNYRQIMHLIDLLLNELKLTGEKEVYNEILYYSNLMFDEVKSKNDFSTLPRLYSQKSRLLLVNGKFDEAEELLIEAKEFFKENKLFALEEIVANELDLIKNEFSKQRQIIESNVSFAEKIDKLHLVDYINQIVRNTK